MQKSFQIEHINILISVQEISQLFRDDHDVENYVLSSLEKTKEHLNDAKSKLDAYYELTKKDRSFARTWSTFQNIIDTYKDMRVDIKKKYNAAIVTNAWMKYYEIYTQYDLIPNHVPNHIFTAFFNAELPGAALCAFNHFMKTMRPDMNFNWYAASLAPATLGVGSKNELEALGDTYGLYRNNVEHWLMTLNTTRTTRGVHPVHINNGDATDIENIKDFEVQIKGTGASNDLRAGVDLYSHDAGIDVSNDFNNQEKLNARIHLGCALAGFKTLKIGGNFIAKQYTFFETLTWNLILIYASLFDEFYICKPLTSRPYNSEIYLVGKKYRGMSGEIETLLVNRLVNFSMRPLIPYDAIKINLSAQVSDIEKISQTIFDQQTKFLTENIELFEKYNNNLNKLQAQLHGQMRMRVDDWLRKYPIARIRDEDQLKSDV